MTASFKGIPSIPLILAALLCIESGCSLGSPFLSGEIECTVVPGAVHPAIAALKPNETRSWTIRWYDEAGRRREMGNIQKPTVITLPPDRVTPILLIEETALPGFYEHPIPASGALFPLHAKEGKIRPELRPDRTQGILARCAEAAILHAAGGTRAGMNLIAGFNWARLEAAVRSLESPETADILRIAEKILEGSFSSRYVTDAPDFLLRSGPFVNLKEGDLLYPAQAHGGIGVLDSSLTAELRLRAGLNRFFSANGVLDLQVEGERIVCTFFRSYD